MLKFFKRKNTKKDTTSEVPKENNCQNTQSESYGTMVLRGAPYSIGTNASHTKTKNIETEEYQYRRRKKYQNKRIGK